jgi:hypothetical protein
MKRNRISDFKPNRHRRPCDNQPSSDALGGRRRSDPHKHPEGERDSPGFLDFGPKRTSQRDAQHAPDVNNRLPPRT